MQSIFKFQNAQVVDGYCFKKCEPDFTDHFDGALP